MQNDAAAAQPMGIDKRQYGRGQAVFAQFTDDKRPFPFSIGSGIEVLECASAAIAKVRAGGRYAFGSGPAHTEKPRPRTVDLGVDCLARQSKRHFYKAGSSLAEAVAAGAQGGYVK